MSHLLRCCLIAAGLVAAFAGGFFLRHRESPVSATEPPRGAKPQAARTVGSATMTGPMFVPADRVDVKSPQIASKKDTIDPNDPAFQMIKNELKIDTSVLDKSIPVPAVLADVKKDDPPPIAPIGSDLNPPSIPMPGSPVPRLDAAPLTIPPIDLAPPPSPTPQAKTVLVNSRQIELDFALTKTGLSKVAAVELWTTRNGGGTWAKTDRIDGCVSPFRSKLGSEGHYGFKLVFESESGQRTEEPKPGQLPDSTLELDTTPPQITIYPVQGAGPGHVLIKWQASDRNLEPNSLRLSYSSDGRNWNDIDTRRKTEPNFDWKLPDGVPAQVFLRISMRDRAGNVGSATTGNKVLVDLIAPEGKIMGVRAVNTNAEIGPMPRIADDHRQLFSFYLGTFR